MNRNCFIITALSLAVSACSSVDNKRALGDFDYAEIEPAKPISVPSHLTLPPERKEFYISNDINLTGPVGKDVDVRAPSLVLPLAESSRATENNGVAEIWFDQVYDELKLKSFIIEALTEQLALDGVELTLIDSNNTIYQSDWYENRVERGFWIFSAMVLESQAKFNYQVTAKPHGRSVSLYVELVEYNSANDPDEVMDQIDKQRAEMAMLNTVVAQVDYKYRLIQQEKIKARAAQKIVSVAINTVGEPAYLVDIELDDLWQNLPYFFENYGFTVNDINETKKIYYVNFEKPDNSLWAVIWGDDVPVIDVADEKYQFVLEETEGKTILTIYNSDGEAVAEDVLLNILPVMEPGLTIDPSLL